MSTETKASREPSGRPRRDHEPPAAVAEWGWRYHHLGIPCEEPRLGETALERLNVHVSGFATSPYGIEWMRFEPGCAVAELVKKLPHIAFEVPDLGEALRGKQVLSPPSSPSPGVMVAMIVHDGVPIELLEFQKPSG